MTMEDLLIPGQEMIITKNNKFYEEVLSKMEVFKY